MSLDLALGDTGDDKRKQPQDESQVGTLKRLEMVA